MMQVAIKDLVTDAGTQMREAVPPGYIEEIAEAVAVGEALPDIVVFDDGERLILSDGFCRKAGFEKAKKKEINAEVRKGSLADAILYAAGSNTKHGLRRTNEDKRKAVRSLLANPLWQGRSDRWVADACKVGHDLVAKLRAETSTGGNASCATGCATDEEETTSEKKTSEGGGNSAQTRTGKDGRKRQYEPLFCERCTRTGPVKDCPKCQLVRRKKRGDGRSKKPRERKARPNGAPVFNLHTAKMYLGKIMAEADKLHRLPGQKSNPMRAAIQRLLDEAEKLFEKWQKEASKP